MKLIVAEPGHFHAALLQKEMYPGLDRRVSVYAQVGFDAMEYVNRIAGFNARAGNPTDWDLDLHFSVTPMEELIRDHGRRCWPVPEHRRLRRAKSWQDRSHFAGARSRVPRAGR